VWVVFLLYVAFSKYGNIKLGKAHEKPEFNNISWFAMLFSCGIAVGVYTYGVAEPMSYYRGGWGEHNLAGRGPLYNDDDRAQLAMMQTFYHWGFHAWAPYIVVAITLGVVCYRWNMPLTMRSAFYPLLGNLIFSPIGDCIDAVAIACTTFGVCTSLGLGVDAITAFGNRLNSDIETDVDAKTWTIVVMTLVANCSVVLGLKKGMQILSTVTFSLGLFALLATLLLDNTWYLLNSYVQSFGHYLNYMIQAGFRTDAFEQLGYDFSSAANMFAGTADTDGNGGSPLYDAMAKANALVDFANISDADLIGASAGMDDYDSATVYGSHARWMMNGWTIFYWGWWVSWAPFVGMFIARISRGRTLRSVITGAFIAPTLFGFLWLCVWGSLGIKMQRAAELALSDGTYIADGTLPDCAAFGYEGSVPTSDAAISLANDGYYLLTCRSNNNKLFDVMSPYGEVKKFLWTILLVGITLYFITSSDSGSYVDDVISANGMAKPPIMQKIFWCWTEGGVAIALLIVGDKAGGNALGAVQAVSIVAGLPFTLMLCFMCTSVWRALKIDAGDDDICQATQWSTGVLDIADAFNVRPANAPAEQRYSAAERAQSLATAVFAPFIGVFKACESEYGVGAPIAKVQAVFNALFFYIWFVLLCMSGEDRQWAWLGWTFFLFHVMQITGLRASVRESHGIYGNLAEDLLVCLCLYPMAVSQLHFQVQEPKANNDVYKKPDQA
jgi:choline-glycine betaine transporter